MIEPVKRIWIVQDLDQLVAAYESEDLAREHAGQFGGPETQGKCDPQYIDVPILTKVPTGITCNAELGDLMPFDENSAWKDWREVLADREDL